MLFRRKKKPEPLPAWASRAVVWGTGSFYTLEGPVNPAGERLYLCPYAPDDCLDFWQFLRRCGARLLGKFPFAVEEVTFFDCKTLDADHLIPAYQAQGGSVLAVDERHLLAISQAAGPKILEHIPEDTMGIDCGYRGYGFRQMPPSGDLADLKKSRFDLMLTAEDLEAHLQIETRRDPLAYCEQ